LGFSQGKPWSSLLKCPPQAVLAYNGALRLRVLMITPGLKQKFFKTISVNFLSVNPSLTVPYELTNTESGSAIQIE
jgi:hypothetical protein